jgi:rhodanese-related sulfurtransferase
VKKPRQRGGGRTRRSKTTRAARLDELVDAAVVDCHDESEAVAGFHAMIQDNLEMPFVTEVLGVDVAVEGVDLTAEGSIVALCRHGRRRQAVPVLHLPLSKPLPKGAECIEAYRRWVRGR